MTDDVCVALLSAELGGTAHKLNIEVNKKMAPAHPIHVLLVEDNQADALRLIHMLRSATGHRFLLRRARRLSEAHRLLQSGRADVALLNLWLPDAHGLDVVSETQRIAPSVPLIVLNGQADDSLAAAALQQGAQDFLIRCDLTNSQLARAVRHAIV